MAKEKNPFYETKQVCVKGKTLLMLKHEMQDREIGASPLIFEILKNHYAKNPPFGYNSK